MDNYWLRIVFNYSIVIAAIIAIFRFKSIMADYYPFIFFIWLGLFNEILSLLLIYNYESNTVNSNLYVLVEYLLLLLQFYKWSDNGSKRYYWLAGIGIAVWIADNFIINTIFHNNSVFRVFYSFIIIFFSIDKVNNLLVFEYSNLLKHPVFITCIAFTFYYGFKAFVESFNMVHLGLNPVILKDLWIILYFVNGTANLLYAIAVLCIPKKIKFISPW
jgi:hypothetical protein